MIAYQIISIVRLQLCTRCSQLNLKIYTMNDNANISDEFEDGISFKESLYGAMAPKVKQFLAEYFGDSFLNLNPETYMEIEALIKEDILLYADEIPDILYRYRTITDDDLFDEALDNFVPVQAPIKWPAIENWFDRDFKKEDDDDTFLEDSAPIDLTEEQKKAKDIINIANDITDNTQNFADFMKSAYEIIMKETQLFIENNASFDLSILSADGFVELQERLNLLVSILSEDLHTLIISDE